MVANDIILHQIIDQSTTPLSRKVIKGDSGNFV